MSATSRLPVKSASRLEVLIVQSNPADTLLLWKRLESLD